MNINFFNKEGGSQITKNSLNISWYEDLTKYKSGDVIETWFEINNNTGSNYTKLKLQVNPDLSIWYFNNRSQLLSELNMQAIIDNLFKFGINSYEEIVFVRPLKYINPRNVLNDVRNFDPLKEMKEVIPGIILRSDSILNSIDDFGFAISEGHIHTDLAEDNSGVAGTYAKSIEVTTFNNRDKLKFWVKITVPESWDSHKNPLTTMIKAYIDNQLVDNYFRLCTRNIYSVLWIPIHCNIIGFDRTDFPFEVGS